MRRGTGDYDAFLSYAWDPADAPGSETSDAAIARRLRYAMQDLGKPRTRRSDLDIFLDRSVQTPSPDLWRGILDNLDRSRFLVVLCSPRSAASDGVAREVQHWLDTDRNLDDLLVVLLDGAPEEALPAPLRRLREEGTYDPLFVDLRWVASARDLDGRTSTRFREDVATLLAPIRGVAKETLVDEELTVRERGLRVQRRFVIGLSVAVVVSLLFASAATVLYLRADREARIAESRALAAGAANQLATGLDVAQLLAVESFRRDDNLEARATLLRATTASPRLVRYLDAGAPITVLTASTDGNTVVAGTDAGRVRRWPVGADGPPRNLVGLTGAVTAAAADADAVAATVWLIDLVGGGVTTLPVADAYSVAFTADRLLVSRGSGAFEVRDRGTRALVASIRGAAPAGGRIATTPDGGLAARLRRDGSVEVVDIARAGVLGVLGNPGKTEYGMLPGLAFTGDGASLAVAYPEDAGWGELDAYDLAPGRLVQVACATAGRDLTPAEWRQFVNDAVPGDLRCAR